MTATPRERIVRALDRRIRARYPLIAVQTSEERRFKHLINEVLQLRDPDAPDDPGRHFAKGLFYWSRVSGLAQVAGPHVKVGEVKPSPDLEEPTALLEHIKGQDKGIFCLFDFGPYLGLQGLEDPPLVRQLRELAMAIKPRGVTVIFVGATFPELASLEKEISHFDLPLPDEDEIAVVLGQHIDRYRQVPKATLAIDDETGRRLREALLGLTIAEAEYALDEATIVHRGLGPGAVPTILEKKRELVAKSGALTYIPPQPPDRLGGYAELRLLAEGAAHAATPAARAFGIAPPKGFLLFGLPGCGKDHFTTILSGILGRALFRLDMGAVIGGRDGTLGSSANEIRRACAMAEVCHAILVIGEFEKAVGGLQSSNRTDGGEVARTIAWLLNWMNDQERAFVVATANDVSQLAPEQVRQGRFGRLVFVDLPTADDREAIFRVHLGAAGRDPARFDPAALAAATDGFSGAEIAAAVQAGLRAAFFAGAPDLTDAHILHAIRTTRPLAHVKAEEIGALRKWAHDHVVVPPAVPTTTAANAQLVEL